MGQYYKIINKSKKEYLDPHHCGDGAKLMEFGLSGEGTMSALAILLATSNGLGGGDLNTEDKTIMGRWAGDSIAIVGDYDDFSPHKGLYDKAENGNKGWRDVSFDAMRVLMEDTYAAGHMAKNTWQIDIWQSQGQALPPAVVKAMEQQKDEKKVEQSA